MTMPPFTDRLSDEAITGVIASFKSLWSNEHRRRHDRHLAPITAITGTCIPGFPRHSV
jgi:mono/diheme cytochrome c family protein